MIAVHLYTCILDSICSSLTGGSGQQCCYDRNELLVTGPPGGGTVDLVSPDVSTVGHFIADVLPFLMCCKAGIFSNCDAYYRHRPSDRGVDFSPPPPPRKYGFMLRCMAGPFNLSWYCLFFYSNNVGRSSHFDP